MCGLGLGKMILDGYERYDEKDWLGLGIVRSWVGKRLAVRVSFTLGLAGLGGLRVVLGLAKLGGIAMILGHGWAV